MSLDQEQAARLVQRAAAGEQQAWDALVEEYGKLIWTIARSYHLTAAEAADVSQTTWLRLCENIDRLRDPSAISAWLATTARRECMSIESRNRSLILVDDIVQLDQMTDEPPVEELLLQREREIAVHAALQHLPPRTRRLVQLLMEDSPPSYEQVSSTLHLPVGSIGPTRGRALRRLRRLLENEPATAP